MHDPSLKNIDQHFRKKSTQLRRNLYAVSAQFRQNSAHFQHNFDNFRAISTQLQHKFDTISAQVRHNFSTISTHHFDKMSAQFPQNFSTISTKCQHEPFFFLTCMGYTSPNLNKSVNEKKNITCAPVKREKRHESTRSGDCIQSLCGRRIWLHMHRLHPIEHHQGGALRLV